MQYQCKACGKLYHLPEDTVECVFSHRTNIYQQCLDAVHTARELELVGETGYSKEILWRLVGALEAYTRP